jgi:hypothetical protein
MEQTSQIYCATKEVAGDVARSMEKAGWTVEVAAKPDADGWLVKAQRSDAEDDDLWAVSRMETFRR